MIYCQSPLKSKREDEARVVRRKITYSETPQPGRMIGHESAAVHFTSFTPTDDAHIVSLSAMKKNKTNLRSQIEVQYMTTISR